MDITSMKMAIKTNSAEAHNIVREDNCIFCVPSHPLLRPWNIEFLREKKKKKRCCWSVDSKHKNNQSLTVQPPLPGDLIGEQAHAESWVKIC